MPLISLDRILTHAAANQYGVGAFLCMNIECAQAAIAAAEAKQSPVAIRIHPELRRVTRFETLGVAIKELAGKARVPVGISLDHGMSIGTTMDAVRAGATTVMMDAAEEPLADNIRKVKAVVEATAELGILVEAAIGHMEHGAVQTDDDYADVEDSVRLIKETGAHILAPAVGNVHGTAHGEGEKATPSLNIDRIRTLRQATGAFLCLHGGSGTPSEMMREATRAGIQMAIIFTDVIGAFNAELRRVLDANPGAFNIVEALEPAQKAVQQVIEGKMDDLGSAGQAKAFFDWDVAQSR